MVAVVVSLHGPVGVDREAGLIRKRVKVRHFGIPSSASVRMESPTARHPGWRKVVYVERILAETSPVLTRHTPPTFVKSSASPILTQMSPLLEHPSWFMTER
jgi:hypothetical protein